MSVSNGSMRHRRQASQRGPPSRPAPTRPPPNFAPPAIPGSDAHTGQQSRLFIKHAHGVSQQFFLYEPEYLNRI